MTMHNSIKLLVTGANGQVGNELLRTFADFSREREIISATRSGALEDGTPCETLDLADFDALTRALDRIAPNVIINAAAYTAVDHAEDEAELAQRINGEALGVLGAWVRQHAARIARTMRRIRSAPTVDPSWPVKSPCAKAARDI